MLHLYLDNGMQRFARCIYYYETMHQETTAARPQSSQLVSVVIPVYNVVQYLEKCLTSVAKQTYQNLEIILIDDGSTDGSGVLCDQWQSQYSNIATYHQTNQGLSAARNAGIEASHGRYLLFVDSDDWIEPTLVGDSLAALTQNDVDVVIYSFNQRTQNGEISGISQFAAAFPDTQTTSSANALRYIFHEQIANYSWSMMAESHLYRDNNIRFPVGYTMEDLATTYKVLSSSRNVHFLSKRLYNYRRRPNSILTANNLGVVVGARYAVSGLIQYFHSHNVDLKTEAYNYGMKFLLHYLFYLYNLREVISEESFMLQRAALLTDIDGIKNDLDGSQLTAVNKLKCLGCKLHLIPVLSKISTLRNPDL